MLSMLPKIPQLRLFIFVSHRTHVDIHLRLWVERGNIFPKSRITFRFTRRKHWQWNVTLRHFYDHFYFLIFRILLFYDVFTWWNFSLFYYHFHFRLFSFHSCYFSALKCLEKCEIFFTLLLAKFNLHRWDSCFFFTCATFLTFFTFILSKKKYTQTDNIRKEIKLKIKFHFNSHLEYIFSLASFSRHAKTLTSAAVANKHQKLSPAWIFKLACATWCIAKDILRKKKILFYANNSKRGA